MTDKVHNVTNLNDPAPEAPGETTSETVKAPGKVKTFLREKKLFFIGLGAGAVAAGGVVAAVKASGDDEELVIEDPTPIV